MKSLKDKKILLGITGSIAAYKTTYLIRGLVKEGAVVKVIMTDAACSFISPLTISTLSKTKVHTHLMDEETWNNHVELGMWADLFIIAPATANTMSKMAIGMADNFLTAVYLSAKCPVWIAPAMDLDMWKHPSTQGNLRVLHSYGIHILNPEIGELASGLYGQGRMMEPESIMDALSDYFNTKNDLAGKKVLITAGPTFENIDPVRFIGNRSSGKMGIALAEECAARGAQVILVLGPSKLEVNEDNIHTYRVVTSDEMYNVANSFYSESDIVIFAAAVADYKVKHISTEKIKKKGETLSLELVKTIDIAQNLGEKKKKSQFHVGFALETNNESEHAKEKLKKKNFDMIVLNSLKDEGAGFQHDTNKVTIFTKSSDTPTKFELKTKKEVATDIVDLIVKEYN